MTRTTDHELARRLHRGTVDALAALDHQPDGDIIRLEPHNGGYRLGTAEQFWGGFMLGRGWLLADLHSDGDLLSTLTSRAPHLDRLMGIANVDTGFAGYYGLAIGYEVTGDERLRERALEGAKNLSELFADDLGVFLTLVPGADAKLADLAFADVFCPRELLVDTAAVLDLLWWASRWEPAYLDQLLSHYDRTLELGVVEADGRSHHALDFTAEGAANRLHTHQGAGPDTPWTRGHAWAAVGYATAYAATGTAVYRDTAVNAASYLVTALGERAVGAYDLAVDPAHAPEDSCSTAIVLTAIERLRAAGVPLPDALATFGDRALPELLDRYLTPGGTLLHGCWGSIGNGPVEAVLPYGNYFLAEAVYRRLRPQNDRWGLPDHTATAAV
jgi:unsaturated chondroitin disaccharide hydrolase